jgi:microcin C transport system permease protein
MSAYIARRIFLMIPTLLGILFVSFVVVQFAPGGPVERVIAQLSGADTGGSSRISGSSAHLPMRADRSIAARRGSIRPSSRASKSSSVSTSRRRNVLR